MKIGIAGYRCLQAQLLLQETLALVRASGAECYEPLGITSDSARDALGAGLKEHQLTLPSVYVNSRLHEPDWGDSVQDVLTQARRAKSLGAELLVTNPQPIAWGQALDKTDTHLETQQMALTVLGKSLKNEGMMLAYHVHDVELRKEALELRAMLDGVPADLMGFCLDAHWLYRGSGNSGAAVDTLLARYASRVCSVHVRQSENGVCGETLCGSDIDWPGIAGALRQVGFDGPVYVELLQEAETAQTRSLLQAHQESMETLRHWWFNSPAS